MAAQLEPAVIAFLAGARVAHLATVSAKGTPLVMPICFALHRARLFLSLDEKPKTGDPRDLQRVRNLRANPRAAVIADRWDENWSRLAWVHLSGPARVIESNAGGMSPDSDTHALAISLLREKYVQYQDMDLDDRPAIVMDIERVRTWGALL
jgi:PPOX class probable F420-dependent enzyme